MSSRMDQKEEILQSQSNRNILSEVFKQNYTMDQCNKECQHRLGAYTNPHICQHVEDLFYVETCLSEEIKSCLVPEQIGTIGLTSRKAPKQR